MAYPVAKLDINIVMYLALVARLMYVHSGMANMDTSRWEIWMGAVVMVGAITLWVVALIKVAQLITEGGK